MKSGPIIVWLRRDLRVDDQPALTAAAQSGAPVLPVFIWGPGELGESAPGPAGRWWLHQSLESLQRTLKRLGSPLVICAGEALAELQRLISETGAEAVYWNRCYESAFIERDRIIKSELQKSDIEVLGFRSNLLIEPEQVLNQQGRPYQVFTPFWKSCLASHQPAEPKPAVTKLTSPLPKVKSVPLESLKLEPRIDWTVGMREMWRPGETGARERLEAFLSNAAGNYHEGRDRPDLAGTSKLSPHLHFGEVSARRVWHDLGELQHTTSQMPNREATETFRRELGWREFAHHILFHFPETTSQPFRTPFHRFPWHEDPQKLRQWQKGLTGYPIVDAGMRELWHTGWMHNRVRMIAGSFLTKDLLISWQSGARWFRDTLVDADLANNTMGWQWVAGCGADAAPYFRIFNPVTQGRKFDPQGTYVRRWVPELGDLPARWIHEPWNAHEYVLFTARVRLGENYPQPIVDHSEARRDALDAFEHIKGK